MYGGYRYPPFHRSCQCPLPCQEGRPEKTKAGVHARMASTAGSVTRAPFWRNAGTGIPFPPLRPHTEARHYQHKISPGPPCPAAPDLPFLSTQPPRVRPDSKPSSALQQHPRSYGIRSALERSTRHPIPSPKTSWRNDRRNAWSGPGSQAAPAHRDRVNPVGGVIGGGGAGTGPNRRRGSGPRWTDQSPSATSIFLQSAGLNPLHLSARRHDSPVRRQTRTRWDPDHPWEIDQGVPPVSQPSQRARPH